MSDPRHLLLHFLLDPTLSQKDFSRLASYIMSGECSSAIRDAENIRLTSRRDRYRYDAVATFPREVEDLVERLDRLLRGEAGLGTAESLHLLAKMLGLHEYSYGKRGFGDEVLRILEMSSPSKVLSVAQRIRDQAIHQDTKDWPLK